MIRHENGEKQEQPDKNIFILYCCNEWKEISSMRIAGVTSDKNVLYTMVGSRIKAGEMLYLSDNKEDSWEYFRRDYQRDEIRLECLAYGYIEEMKDLSLPDPELLEEFEDALLVHGALQRGRIEELIKPLALDKQRLVFSIVDMQSDYRYERAFLPGYGTEESLKESELFRHFAEDDEYMDIHVNVSSYAVGIGEVREADWSQTKIIEEHFAEMVDIYDVNLLGFDCYDICCEMEQEEP